MSKSSNGSYFCKNRKNLHPQVLDLLIFSRSLIVPTVSDEKYSLFYDCQQIYYTAKIAQNAVIFRF